MVDSEEKFSASPFEQVQRDRLARVSKSLATLQTGADLDSLETSRTTDSERDIYDELTKIIIFSRAVEKQVTLQTTEDGVMELQRPDIPPLSARDLSATRLIEAGQSVPLIAAMEVRLKRRPPEYLLVSSKNTFLRLGAIANALAQGNAKLTLAPTHI